MAVHTLAEFYGLMRSTVPVRRALTEAVLASRPPSPEAVARIRGVLAALEAIPEGPGGRRLDLDGGRTLDVDLSYEIEELKKDTLYLDAGEDALLANLAERHPELPEEVRACAEALKRGFFQAFVTDRDGTVNNYCGRYASSVQSAWNAVFLTRFARVRSRRSVILTSAPLTDVGIVDVSVSPADAFVLAGSKGREYLDPDGRRREQPIELEKHLRLDALNQRLDTLLRKNGNEVFTLIGSGLQRKFGQTTVAYGDIADSIPAPQAERFREEVRGLVRDVDPDERFFRIEDTGLDLEILLTVDEDRGGLREFDKGDGVRFLDEDARLAMGRGACLVCGDTASDLAMLEASLELAPHTRAVFVTRDDELRQQVRDRLPGALFVSEPDTLVAALNVLARPAPAPPAARG
jgi:hypothetical protein